MESARELSNSNFQWTKTLFFKGLRCSNTKENFSWKSEKMNVKFHKNKIVITELKF